jgi:hypothetical protein
MVIDSTFFIATLVTALQNNIGLVDGGEILTGVLGADFLTTLNNTDINQFAMEIDGVLTDREEYYFGTLEQVNRKMINVQYEMNLEMNVVSTTPVKESLSGLYFIGLFLQSTFATIVFFMLLLSMMLIYSLMISDVDEKTYEMGMLRALGLRTVSIMQLVIIQSMLFSIPGVIIGIAISAIANVGLRLFIFIYSAATYTFLFSAASTILGLILGLAMPLFSNIWAIQRALGKKIRDSLDIFHTGINEVLVRIIKLENFGISPFEIVLGVTLVVMGLLTYYIAPAAFLFDRLDLFFFILNIILVGMIIGLSFLCFLIFPYIQVGLIYVFTWMMRFDIKLRPLILKNTQHSHKKRNMKTSMMFTIALAYLVFGGSSLLLIGNMVLGFVKSFVGADIVATSILSDNNLPENDLQIFLQNEIDTKTGKINAFSFRGNDLTDYFSDIFGAENDFYLSSGGDFPENNIRLYPVDKNYIDSCLIDFYIPKYGQPGFNFENTRGKDDFIKSLHTNEGTSVYGTDIDPFNVASRGLSDQTSDDVSWYAYDPTQQIKMILPEGIQDVLSIAGGDSIKLNIENPSFIDSNMIFRVLVRGMPQKVPGFFFMSYKQVQFFLQGIISFEQAFELTYLYGHHTTNVNRLNYDKYIASDDATNSTFSIPKERLLIRLNEGPEQRR